MKKAHSLYPVLISACLFSFGWLGKAQQQKPVVHDPVMAAQSGKYYLFCTGYGISNWQSDDMVNWAPLPPIFKSTPEWVMRALPDFKNHFWAPDIQFLNNKYYLFYSVSAFGKNTSCIGVATNATLNPEAKEYNWVDQGCVIQSVPNRDMWNAIDPNVVTDTDKNTWMVFGSFWEGIKLVKLNSDATAVETNPQQWYSLARRTRTTGIDDADPGDGPIEAPFIFQKNGYYYLFVSVDYCCRGINSNYKVLVSRSKNVTGPYVDKDGQDMLHNGGTPIVTGNVKWPGAGHNAVYTINGTDYIIFHAYEAATNGIPRLIVRTLSWTNDGWPLPVELP